MKTSALSAISQSGARSTLRTDASACSRQFEEAEDGSVKVLNGGVEEDSMFTCQAKNPGSGLASFQAKCSSWHGR